MTFLLLRNFLSLHHPHHNREAVVEAVSNFILSAVITDDNLKFGQTISDLRELCNFDKKTQLI
jgi:hypothetical protein